MKQARIYHEELLLKMTGSIKKEGFRNLGHSVMKNIWKADESYSAKHYLDEFAKIMSVEIWVLNKFAVVMK